MIWRLPAVTSIKSAYGSPWNAYLWYYPQILFLVKVFAHILKCFPKVACSSSGMCHAGPLFYA